MSSLRRKRQASATPDENRINDVFADSDDSDDSCKPSLINTPLNTPLDRELAEHHALNGASPKPFKRKKKSKLSKKKKKSKHSRNASKTAAAKAAGVGGVEIAGVSQ